MKRVIRDNKGIQDHNPWNIKWDHVLSRRSHKAWLESFFYIFNLEWISMQYESNNYKWNAEMVGRDPYIPDAHRHS